MKRLAFEKVARAFIASRASKGTRDLYALDLSRWLTHCELENVNPAQPTLEAATKFRDNMKDANLTVRRRLSALSKMYRAAMANRVASWNPFDADALPRPPGDVYSRTALISEEDAQKIIESTAKDTSALGLRDLAILRMLYDTGLRRESVMLLLRRNVILRDGGIVVRVRLKGNKWGEVELPSRSAKALSRWLEASPEGVRAFGEITPSAANKILKKRAKVVGLKAHPHQFRATFITTALDAGVPLNAVQLSVHHANPVTTQRYDHGKRGEGVTAAVDEYRRNK